MSETSNKIQRASPPKVASVMAIGRDASRLWEPEELESVFRHQMAAPLSIDLGSLNPAVGAKLRTLTEASGLLLKSFRDIFEHPDPPLELLQIIKEFGKINRGREESAIPDEVASVLYYLSIAAALVRKEKRISTLSETELRSGLSWVLAQTWIDGTTRALVSEALQKLGQDALG